MVAHIHNQTFWLLSEKALFLPEHKTLVVADVHVGKAAHFRKNGVAMPVDAVQNELAVLSQLITQYVPDKLVFLGDLFHAAPNAEWQALQHWLAELPSTEAILVRGNHDTHVGEDISAQITVVNQWQQGNLLLTHEPLVGVPEGFYNICGHIHPGVRLVGKGKQQLRLPCFHFTKNQGILPAFDSLTGAVALPTKGAEVFAVVAGKQVLRV